MKLSRLYIENFMCYDKSFIDFTEFSAALIVGNKDNNDEVANGVGKTTIFRAIEYVLFNTSDQPLDSIIRDDTNACKVVLDFSIGDQDYRISRSRTKKGSTDLSFYEKTGSDGEVSEKWHTAQGEPVINEKYWKDISGRRASDTEKDLAKLIKVNYKSFRVFVHFVQHDFTGLTTATPEKRKGILKEALGLLMYSKMEKIAKDKSASMAREIEEHRLILNTLGDPEASLITAVGQVKDVESKIQLQNDLLQEAATELLGANQKIDALIISHTNVESKFSGLAAQEKTLLADKSKIETSVKEYQSKKTNIIKAANELVAELKQLEIDQTKLAILEYSQIDILNEKVSEKKDALSHNNIVIQKNTEEYDNLKIPLPDDSICKHCRQPLTAEHRIVCQQEIDQQMVNCQKTIRDCKKKNTELTTEIAAYTQTINSLNLSKQQLESINTKIVNKNQEIQDKKNFHSDYATLLNKFTSELSEKNSEIAAVTEQLSKSPIEEAKSLQSKIDAERKNIEAIVKKNLLINKEITLYSSNKAVLQHNIEQMTQNKAKKDLVTKSLSEVEAKYKFYPSVIQAFSSTGIPNLIIQNILDDLQTEANNLLSQIKPDIRLSFFVEKTKGDGTDADTLDIKYQVGGRNRYYAALSGAQQMAVTFSLKLGLSFLLQKIMGVDIKFLLLDELDQPMDKASVDAYADIIKFFQKEFTICVITHNDRLKDKFSHAILVEQDINMISRAKVVSSW